MDEQATWEALERLGAVRRGHFQQGDRHSDVQLLSANPLDDPRAANTLAQRLAAALPPPPPDVILAWAGLPSVLVGLLVGIALDRRVVRLADDEGVVYASSPLQRGERAALVGDLLTEREVRLARAYVENRGALLVSLGAWVDDGRVGPLAALVSLEGHRYPASDCPLCRRGLPLQGGAANRSAGAPL